MNPNYTTLNKDIALIRRSNNGLDLWFDNGDLVKAEGHDSLQTGIIIACLTSWNYLNRYGNPTYEIFGNRAYSLLKHNKNNMVAYKIRQYFLECLNRMRRIYEVVNLDVYELPNEPYTYFVEFSVISMSNELISGEFPVSLERGKSTSYISYTLYMPYASPTNPLTIDLYLRNEYGGGISDEIIYMYVDDEFIGLKGKTDKEGYLRVTYEPTKLSSNSKISFRFQGNVDYNRVISEEQRFIEVPFLFNINSDGVLYYTTNIEDMIDEFHLAEIIPSTTIDLTDELISWNKLYLLATSTNTFDIYKITTNNGDKILTNTGETINLYKDEPFDNGDIHLVVQTENHNYLIDIDNHLYLIGE